MLFKNIYVYNNNGTKELKHVQITEEGVKTVFNIDDDLSSLSEKTIECRGAYFLMPGMLDTHVHGQGGVDFVEANEEGLETIVSALGETGLSYALATFVSMPIPALKQSLAKLNAFMQKQDESPKPGCTQIVGVHLEGPFISKQCKGAHDERVLQNNISMDQFKDIIRAAPYIKEWKITIDPALPGAIEFIQQTKELEQENIFVKVFIGHSNPDEAVITQAIKAGAAGFTHLGNACQESCSREKQELAKTNVKSRVVQWVLENPEPCPPGVELILDGVHLSPSFVSLISQRIKNKIVLVTDALGPTGCEDGLYQLGALRIRKEKDCFYLIDDQNKIVMREERLLSGDKIQVKTLAGSGASLARCASHYFKLLFGETVSTRMDFLYTAVITNPRISSLSEGARNKLPENNNFTLFNYRGELVLSLCHGQLKEHQSLQMQATAIIKSNGPVFRANSSNPSSSNGPFFYNTI